MQPFNGVLFAGGLFFIGGAGTLQGIARWDGSMWTTVGGGVGGGTPGVSALAVFDDGVGPALYAGGRFTTAGGGAASHIARWNGTTWSTLGSGVDPGTAGQSGVFALIVYDDGSGPALYVGGDFPTAGAAVVNNMAKWNGSFWEPLQTGVSRTVQALAVFDDGAGPALYVGGEIFNQGGFPASNVLRWSAGAWSGVSGGLNGTVYALRAWNGNLYAGGNFTASGATAVNHVARWNGVAWSALGSGLDDQVYSLTTFDDGNGESLYAGGSFLFAGPTFVNHVARWSGTTWSILAGGTNGPALGMGADGHSLVVGGLIGAVGNGQSAAGVARWINCTPCYPNCDGSTSQAFLNVLDFACFLNKFAAADPYANCDGSTTPPVLNVLDFACFLNKFATGCP